MTEDSIGFRLGPGTGALTIRLDGLAAVQSPFWSLEVLAASNRPEGSTIFRTLTWGSCGANCPPDPGDVQAPLSQDFAWVNVLENEQGVTFVVSTDIPNDAVVTFRGADIDILDIRTPTPSSD